MDSIHCGVGAQCTDVGMECVQPQVETAPRAAPTQEPAFHIPPDTQPYIPPEFMQQQQQPAPSGGGAFPAVFLFLLLFLRSEQSPSSSIFQALVPGTTGTPFLLLPTISSP